MTLTLQRILGCLVLGIFGASHLQVLFEAKQSVKSVV